MHNVHCQRKQCTNDKIMHSDIKDVASVLDPSHWYWYRIIIIMIQAYEHSALYFVPKHWKGLLQWTVDWLLMTILCLYGSSLELGRMGLGCSVQHLYSLKHSFTAPSGLSCTKCYTAYILQHTSFYNFIDRLLASMSSLSTLVLFKRELFSEQICNVSN